MTEIVIPEPHYTRGSGSLQRFEETPRWSLDQLVASWLAQFDSDTTRDGYRRDMRQFLGWCAENELAPLNLGLPEVQMFGEYLRRTGDPRRGKPYSARTIARKLNAVSSFYAYCARAGVISHNPARDAKRPTYDRKYSPTQSFGAEHARAMLAHAPLLRQRVMPPRAWHIVMLLMVDLGARVTEVCRIDTTSFGHRDGIRTVTMQAKGAKTRVRPVTAHIGPVIDAWIEERDEYAPADEPAFLVDNTGRRITRNQVYELIRRLGKSAGVPDAERISPHSCRHAFNEIARERGASLEARQTALGHESSATTQLYDHQGADLASDPAHVVSASTFTPYIKGSQ